MQRFLGAVLAATIVVLGPAALVRAADPDPGAVLDKAIKALGGEEMLKKAETATWKSKGTLTFNGNDNAFTVQSTTQGLDHYRSVFEGQFGDNEIKAVAVVNGTKGWRKFGDNNMEMGDDELANEKRNVYLMVTPMTILPLKGKGFKVESAGEEKVGDKPAAVLKVTGPDSKDFKLYFDKESGLPVKLVARVIGFGGEEFTQESTFSEYKDFGGIKKASKSVSKRDGEDFVKSETVEFKVLDKVDPKTFTQPD
jgi:hypothetical protein